MCAKPGIWSGSSDSPGTFVEIYYFMCSSQHFIKRSSTQWIIPEFIPSTDEKRGKIINFDCVAGERGLIKSFTALQNI